MTVLPQPGGKSSTRSMALPGKEPGPSPVVVVLTVLASLTMLVPGTWAWLAPESFAVFVNWPHHAHFAHDAGVFQIAIGMMLLASLRWRDALAVGLGGFLVANTLHAFNHVNDLRLEGGRPLDAVLLGAVSVLGLIAVILRIRQLRAAGATREGAR